MWTVKQQLINKLKNSRKCSSLLETYLTHGVLPSQTNRHKIPLIYKNQFLISKQSYVSLKQNFKTKLRNLAHNTKLQ